MTKILVTGAAGFIGFHLAKRLLEDGLVIAGLDNLNDYYDVNLKQARLRQLQEFKDFSFYEKDLTDCTAIEEIFRNNGYDVVVHLAAQPRVRHSLKNPHACIQNNIIGFMNVLEGCQSGKVKHLVFASSSSVYGMNSKIPFSVSDHVDHPVSLYAASKKSNELMAHTYAHLYDLPCTGLRFFTVYGPWGRPDMAYFSFTKAIMEEKPIDVFNFGKMKRDFTYIDDVIEGLVLTLNKIPPSNPDRMGKASDPGTSCAPYKIYNIGNNRPEELIKFIEILEQYLGKKAQINMLPMQPGDVPVTYADIDDLMKDVGFNPKTTIEEGLKEFVGWYRWYYQL